MSYIERDVSARISQCFFRCLPRLSATALLFVSAFVWASPSSFVFDDFGVATSDYRVDFLGKSSRPDLAGNQDISEWEQWCFRITSLQATTGEFTHFGVHLTYSQHQGDSGIQNEIENSMSVDPNDSDYSKDYKSSGGPLSSEIGSPMVLWNNLDDNVTGAGESAKFCYSAPAISINKATVGLKVGGDKRSADLLIVKSTSVPTLPFYMLLLLALMLMGLAFKYQRKSYQQK